MQKNNAVSRNFFELSICIFPFIWQFFNFIEKLNNYISVYVNLAHMYVCPHFSPKLLEMDPTNHIYSERAWPKDGFCDIKNMGHSVTKTDNRYIGDAHP